MENLPSFPDEKALKAYAERRCPSYAVKRVWRCKFCGMWHFTGGQERRAELPEGFESTVRARKPKQQEKVSEPDLPKRELPPKPVQKAEPKREPPKPKPTVKLAVEKGQGALW